MGKGGGRGLGGEVWFVCGGAVVLFHLCVLQCMVVRVCGSGIGVSAGASLASCSLLFCAVFGGITGAHVLSCMVFRSTILSCCCVPIS